MERYQDKKVVIIGGTSGMGLATAKMLLDGGARVLVTGRSKAGLESAQNELGKNAIVVSSDARSVTEIDALASLVKAEFSFSRSTRPTRPDTNSPWTGAWPSSEYTRRDFQKMGGWSQRCGQCTPPSRRWDRRP